MQKLNNVTILHKKKTPTELYDLKVHAKKSVTNGGKKERYLPVAICPITPFLPSGFLLV